MSEIKAQLDLHRCEVCAHPVWRCQCPPVDCEVCMDTGLIDHRPCPVCAARRVYEARERRQ